MYFVNLHYSKKSTISILKMLKYLLALLFVGVLVAAQDDAAEDEQGLAMLVLGRTSACIPPSIQKQPFS